MIKNSKESWRKWKSKIVNCPEILFTFYFSSWRMERAKKLETRSTRAFEFVTIAKECSDYFPEFSSRLEAASRRPVCAGLPI